MEMGLVLLRGGPRPFSLIKKAGSLALSAGDRSRWKAHEPDGPGRSRAEKPG